MNRLVSLIFFFTVIGISFGQESDTVVNLTDLEAQKYYFTRNRFEFDRDGLHLFYSLIFDDKNSWDDESIKTIYILIPSPTLTEFSLQNFLKYYSEQHVFVRERDTQQLSGKITILELSDSSIKADLNIEILFQGQRISCVGKKEFRKE